MSSWIISTGWYLGCGTFALNSSSFCFHSRSCSVAASIRAAASDLSIIAFHFRSTPSSSGFSRSTISCGFIGSTGNFLIRLWFAATSNSTAKGSKTHMMIRITHLTASDVSTSLVIPQSITRDAMYFTGPTSASSLIILASNGSLSIMKSSILFCAFNMFASATSICELTSDLSSVFPSLSLSIRFWITAVSTAYSSFNILILACASEMFLLISARSSFCDAFSSAAAFSSLKKDLLEVNTSLTSLSSTFNRSLRSFTVLVSTASSVLNLSCTSLRLCCSRSIASLFDVPVFESVFSARSMIFNCLLM